MVMFCDLVGSTDLSERLDPEDFGEMVLAYQETGREIVEEHGGFVAHYAGDGLLSFFGYPLAHEDDADRAVMAALSILGAMPGLNIRARRLGDVTLQARRRDPLGTNRHRVHGRSQSQRHLVVRIDAECGGPA